MLIFADCQLDPEQYTLHRDAQSIRLRPKVFQLLMYLIECRDRVVTRQELAQTIWPDQMITDAALESGVRAARKAVGDSGRSQTIIQTYHGPRLPLRCAGFHPTCGKPYCTHTS